MLNAKHNYILTIFVQHQYKNMANIKKSREEKKIAKTFCVTTGPLEIFQETCKKLKKIQAMR
ncbi:hypothetical protein Phi13:2_gp012 [Cellulophaga phage phi13:2]|uniref:Uncharacterized protein n=1 Tax=Cellulophaga phage phi13:2 TaxID=1328030 RepID=S0A5H3_9CAUD|nr:hypothetical protein Phi13:2_gp012 [Cellulophaga phage phi13:2]AGO49622.1 hypothetical protein Phi13:2_gp012 [Cellulophaga phage phi13:2]